MIRGIALGETEDVQSEYDKEEPRTTWKIGVISSDIMAEIDDRVTIFEADREVNISDQSRTARTKLQVNQANVEYVRHGLKGFVNFADSNGVPFKFESEKRFVAGRSVDVLAEHLLILIPFPIITELAMKIRSKNRLSVDESKNSDSQLKPSASNSAVSPAPRPSEVKEAVRER